VYHYEKPVVEDHVGSNRKKKEKEHTSVKFAIEGT